MKKTILITVALAIFLTLVLVSPALAFNPIFFFTPPFTTGHLSQTISYDFEGQIDFKKQAGHLCNTGAEMKQVISGTGKLEKSSEIYMKAYFLDVIDSNSFVTAPEALKNLEVITAIKLCSPAKHLFASDFVVPYSGIRWEEGDVVPTPVGYGNAFIQPVGYGFGWDAVDLNGDPLFTPLTKQIWATSVSADPGQMGNYTGGFKAAYGPWDQIGNADNAWWYVYDKGDPTFSLTNIEGVEVGEDYVGNYFHITQFARTSMGTTKRFIDISSPWSHAYLSEDMTIVGMAEVNETFMMDNIKEGEAAATDWWGLF